MTRPLRRHHLRIWIALAILLPFLFARSLMVQRATTPVNRALDWGKFR